MRPSWRARAGHRRCWSERQLRYSRRSVKIIEDFPHRVRSIEHVWIPTADGKRLAARVWLPEGAQDDPVPAIVEYIPYRKRDLTRHRDSMSHPYFAGHGYACVRIDLRGSGESEGVLEDEYLEQELRDGEDALSWIAAQPWCNGRVGMFGISWGGFNGLQIAARRPEPLATVITVCSTDDRYADDVHYMGGCLLVDNLSWASVMFERNACPPDPDLVGDAWRDMWLERLRGSGLWVAEWLRHPRRDAYWQHGSICEDFSAVRCPVFAVSGWADGYSNAVFRLLEHLDVPRKGLIGPWSHRYPHRGKPGPAIGFLQECLRWWDRWLKGVDNDVMAEPMLRVWMQQSAPPATAYHTRPGRWVAEPAWPSPHRTEMTLRLRAPGQLVEAAASAGAEGDRSLNVQSPLTVGLFAGKWCSYSLGPDQPGDQRHEDAGSLVFDSLPLEEPLELLGAPIARLTLSVTEPVAMVAVRLSDVAEDGKVTRVSYGLLNLTHRDGHARPEPLEPGRTYEVSVQLNHIAQRFSRGHRLRLAVSTSYWPLAWPSPRPVRLTLFPKSSVLELPVRPPRESDGALRSFPPAEGARPLTRSFSREPQRTWKIERDLATEESTLVVTMDDGTYRLDEIDLELESATVERYTCRGDDFESPRGEITSVRRFRRGAWHTRVVTRTVMTATPEAFRIRAEIDAYEGEHRVHCESWDETIVRDHV